MGYDQYFSLPFSLKTESSLWLQLLLEKFSSHQVILAPGLQNPTPTCISPFINFLLFTTANLWAGLPRWLNGQESTCQCRRHRFDPWVGKDPLQKETATHLPGKSHGQRTLAGYSPGGCRGVSHNLATKQQTVLLHHLLQLLKSSITHVTNSLH